MEQNSTKCMRISGISGLVNHSMPTGHASDCDRVHCPVIHRLPLSTLLHKNPSKTVARVASRVNGSHESESDYLLRCALQAGTLVSKHLQNPVCCLHLQVHHTTFLTNLLFTRLALNHKRLPYRVEYVSLPDIEPRLQELGIPPSSHNPLFKYTLPSKSH
jgi:hypothetical protein